MSQIAIGELFNSAIQVVEDYVNEVQIEIESVFDEFHKVAVIDNQLEPLYRIASSMETTYNEQVLQGIKTAISSWTEGEGSYVQITQRFKMGEDAKAQAETQQSQIVDVICNIPEITIISDNLPDFTNSNFETENIKSKLDEISTRSKKLKDIAEEKNAELVRLSEENESIKTIVNVGVTYGLSISNFVIKVTEEISNYLSEQMNTMEQENESAIDNAQQEAERFNQSMDENINSIKNFLSDLFD